MLRGSNSPLLSGSVEEGGKKRTKSHSNSATCRTSTAFKPFPCPRLYENAPKKFCTLDVRHHAGLFCAVKFFPPFLLPAELLPEKAHESSNGKAGSALLATLTGSGRKERRCRSRPLHSLPRTSDARELLTCAQSDRKIYRYV